MIRTTAICKVTDEAEVVVERDVILDNPTLTLEVRGCGACLPQTPGSERKRLISPRGVHKTVTYCIYT